MTDIFYEFLSIKKPQAVLQSRETTIQNYHTMQNQNTKKNPGSSLHFLSRRERWEWIISAVWIADFLYFYFVTILRQKHLWRTYAYSWTSPLPP